MSIEQSGSLQFFNVLTTSHQNCNEACSQNHSHSFHIIEVMRKKNLPSKICISYQSSQTYPNLKVYGILHLKKKGIKKNKENFQVYCVVWCLYYQLCMINFYLFCLSSISSHYVLAFKSISNTTHA